MIGANVMDAVYCELCNEDNWRTVYGKMFPDKDPMKLEYANFNDNIYIFRNQLLNRYAYVFVAADSLGEAVKEYFNSFMFGVTSNKS